MIKRINFCIINHLPYINEVYYDGDAYYSPNDDGAISKLMQYIVPNLYGIDYGGAQWA
ncbi:MAG: hypothetical protein UFJ18_10815 [Blautia sp.]|nr:hypothetical protein [Blautia sp.]